MWCWRRLLRVPWTARRSNQSILKEISPGCSLEGQMLKLKLQYFGHLMRRAGKDWGQEEKGTTGDEMVGWHHRLNGHEFGWTPGVGDRQGGLACCGSWGRKESEMTEQLNRTELSMWRHKRCWFDPWVGKIPWKRAWQPTPVFLFGQFHEQRSLEAYGPLAHRGSDMTEESTNAQFRHGGFI